MSNEIANITDKKLAEVKALPAFASSLVPKDLGEAMQMATFLSKSNIIPKDFYGKPENCLLAIGLGMEIGLPPMQAIQNIMIINGRPSLFGDAVLGLVLGSGLCEKFEESSVAEIAKQGYGRCVVKRTGMKEMEVHFSMDDAKKAGLLGKPGPWQQYPNRMLQMRARSWALRDCFSDVLKGIQVREEVEDFQVKKPLQMPQEIKTVEPVVTETPADRIAKARAAFAEKYQATDEEMDALISRLIAESDGNLSEEELPDALTGLWNDLRQGKAAPDVVFNRIGIAKEKKK